MFQGTSNDQLCTSVSSSTDPFSRKSSEDREKFCAGSKPTVYTSLQHRISYISLQYQNIVKIKRTSIKLQSNLNRKPHFLTSLASSLFPAIRNKNSSAQISRYSSLTSIQKLTLLYDFPSCCHSYLSHSPTSAVPVLSKYIFAMLLLLRALQQNLFGLF